jgi:hypothetical protein
MDVNKKYCQSCHLISRNGLSLRKYRAHRYGQCNQNAAATSREYAERFPPRKDTILGHVSY